MDLLTLLPILESNLERRTISMKSDVDALSYIGDISSVTVNSSTFSDIIQLFLTIDSSKNLILHINHIKQNFTTDFNLSDVNNISVTLN